MPGYIKKVKNKTKKKKVRSKFVAALSKPANTEVKS